MTARIKGLSWTESVFFKKKQKKTEKGFTFILKSFPSFPGRGGFLPGAASFEVTTGEQTVL